MKEGSRCLVAGIRCDRRCCFGFVREQRGVAFDHDLSDHGEHWQPD